MNLRAPDAYMYMGDLRKIDDRRPPHPVQVPRELAGIATPLKAEAWEAELRTHPDQEFVAYITSGIRNGFRIGYNYGAGSPGDVNCRIANNMQSARTNPKPIDDYIKEELRLGRIIRLEEGRQCEGVHVSRFGVIPKPHQPGKWRLITDLSSPKGVSVNDGIDPALCSVSYASLDDAVRVIMRLGKGTLLAKLDVASAYRIVPVHPVDRPLLGMRWRGELYVDGSLPFGLRSAPKIFTALADALLWIMGNQGVSEAMHYLDDFLILGRPESDQCRAALQSSLHLCEALGVPIAEQKIEGPATELSFLGIQIDSVAGTLRLPPEKLRRLQVLVKSWQGKKSCKKRDLLSLIGQLQHACRVVKAGRTFLWRMIRLSTVPKELHHWVRLNRAFLSDLQWWDFFLEDWNGVMLCSGVSVQPPTGTITSDASGHWGCGAFNNKGQWFQLRWPAVWSDVHITVKELLPIVVACAVWGRQWRGKAVRCRCDNAAVVAIMKSGTSKHPLAMHLVRCLFFFTAGHQLTLRPEHLPGRENVAADHLSRDALSSFMQLTPGAEPHPTTLPDDLVAALVTHRPDWTSSSWKAVLRSSLGRD